MSAGVSVDEYVVWCGECWCVCVFSMRAEPVFLPGCVVCLCGVCMCV